MSMVFSARNFDENLENFELFVRTLVQKRGNRKPFVGKPWGTYFSYKLKMSMLEDPRSFMNHILNGAEKAVGKENGIIEDFDYVQIYNEVHQSRDYYSKYFAEVKAKKDLEERNLRVYNMLREKYNGQDLPVLKEQVGENEYSYCGEELEKFDRGEQFMSESKLVNRGRCFETGRYKIYKNKQKDFDTSKFPKGNCDNWMEVERGTDEWGEYIITKADFDSGD